MSTKRQQPSFQVGIDTGGTCTDVVIVDAATGDIRVTAKTPTTHHDLGIGVLAAFNKALESGVVDPRRIETVAISTTLATNAVVEGHGARVGLIVIGHTKTMHLPADSAVYLPGGHTINGEEAHPLNVEMLLKTALKFKNHVDAYAICAAMSFTNPTHELVAARAIGLTDPKPVFCSHQISSRAGLKERAATAVLNARLMPVMQGFIDRVVTTLGEMEIPGRVSIVRGDGRVMDISEAVERAASSVASGPAATTWFGARCCPEDAGLIVDVGGTTTDISMIEKGRPVVDDSGSHIGEWETHVDAIRTYTVGIGGDSHVQFDRSGTLSIGPTRVVPLAMAGPIPPPQEWLGRDPATKSVLLSPKADAATLAASRMLSLLQERGAMTPAQLARLLELGEMVVSKRLQERVHAQEVIETGFTPTDALHALGHLAIGNREFSLSGARAVAGMLGLSWQAACERILQMTRQRIEDAIVDHVVKNIKGRSLDGFLPDRRDNPFLRLDFTLKMPIVGIGAAARYLLPEVARSLNTRVLFPEHYTVGNALGAVLLARREGMPRERGDG